MMLFDTRAALAKIEKSRHPPASFASSASLPAARPQKEAKEAEEAALQGENSKSPNTLEPVETVQPGSPSASPYGQTFTGQQKTWSGALVSPETWHGLSESDKHGSTGKMWNGLTRQWEESRSSLALR